MIVPKLQNLFFGDNQTNIIPTGANLITNGSFNASLTGWTADDFSWSAGTAAYGWTSGCYRGSIKQAVALTANKKYKLTFKYKADSPFDIYVFVQDNSNPSISIGTQTITRTVSNGLWQVYEQYITSPTDITALITLGIRSVGSSFDIAYSSDYGGDVFGACNDSNNAESGFYFDDVTLHEMIKINRNCEDDDMVVMDSNKPIEFQVKLESNESTDLLGIDLSSNPLELIEIDPVSGYYPFTVIPMDSNDEFVFYLTGLDFQPKVFKFGWVGFGGADQYNVSSSDGVYEIIIRTVAGFVLSEFHTNLLAAFNDIIDVVCGTTTIYFIDFFIANPIGTIYLSDPDDVVASLFTTPQFNADDFYYTGAYNPSLPNIRPALCFDRFSDANGQIIFNPVTLISGKRYKFSIEYNSDFSDFDVSLIIDDGTNPPYSADFSIVSSSLGTSDVYFTALLTGSHDLKISFVDSAGHMQGFCIYSMTLNSASITDFIDSVVQRDCNGNETELTYSYETSGDNALIQITPTACLFTIIVRDTLGNQFESVSIRTVDFNSIPACERNLYIKLNWFDTCMFGNVDYKNLPFMNEVYLYGSIKEVGNISKERINYFSPTGAIEPVFSHSLISQTITIANYSNTLHRQLAKIFEHRYFYVNDERGKIDNSKYEIVKLKDGMSTGEIEYIIDGSELVNSNCCC